MYSVLFCVQSWYYILQDEWYVIHVFMKIILRTTTEITNTCIYKGNKGNVEKKWSFQVVHFQYSLEICWNLLIRRMESLMKTPPVVVRCMTNGIET